VAPDTRIVGDAAHGDMVLEHVTYSPQQLGLAAVLAFPQHLGTDGETDFRVSAHPGHAAIRADGATRPAVARIEAWGAEVGETWGYTQRPGYSSVPGGTAAGGWAFMPPEVRMDDRADSFAPAGVTASSAYFAFVPGAYAAWGVPSSDGDLSDGAWREGSSGTSLILQSKVSGSWVTHLTIPQSGPVDFAYGVALNVTATIANYVALTTDNVIEVDCSTGDVTVTLYSASNAGKHLYIRRVDASANLVIVDGDGADTINGAATVELASQYDSVHLYVSSASSWGIL